MNRQEKITFLNDLRAGKTNIDALSDDRKSINKASVLELKILKEITLKPGNGNQARRLTELLRLNLTDKEREFINRLIEETGKRAEGYHNGRGTEFFQQPLEEMLCIYFSRIEEFTSNLEAVNKSIN